MAAEWPSGGAHEGAREGARKIENFIYKIHIENRSKNVQRRCTEKHFCVATTFKNFRLPLDFRPRLSQLCKLFFFGPCLLLNTRFVLCLLIKRPFCVSYLLSILPAFPAARPRHHVGEPWALALCAMTAETAPLAVSLMAQEVDPQPAPHTATETTSPDDATKAKPGSSRRGKQYKCGNCHELGHNQ